MATVPPFAIVPALPKGHEATPTRGGRTHRLNARQWSGGVDRATTTVVASCAQFGVVGSRVRSASPAAPGREVP